MLATIQRIIALKPIPNADLIECAVLLGWETVVKKGEFKQGDLCVWHTPDTVVDMEQPQYAFLAKSGGRLKATRIRGQISQGLAMPLSVFSSAVFPGDLQLEEGLDVTDRVGIKKYEKPPAWSGSCAHGVLRAWPTFLLKTDEPNLRNYPKSLALDYHGKEAYATMKCDGSSITIYMHNGVFGVCQRNYEALRDARSPYWNVADKFGVESRLRALGCDNIAIQGEMCGTRINGDRMKIGANLQLYIFQVWDIVQQQFLNVDAARSLIDQLNTTTITSAKYDDDGNEDLPLSSSSSYPLLQWVPIVWRDVLDVEKHPLGHWIQVANALEFPNKAGPAEGLVLRLTKESWSPYMKNRVSTKIISERYALKHGE